MKTYLLRVPEDLFKNFKIASVKNDITMCEILNIAIERYLKTENKKEAL
jgi:hypothetical protein